MADSNQSFLGTGWSFPPTFSSTTNTVKTVSGVDDINESIQILLSTALGERVKREDFGASLTNFVFEPTSTANQALLKNLVEKAILLNEPRIRLDKLVLEPEVEAGLINISIEYTVRSTNTRTNFVYPFYIIEGTNI